jgi:hypothetical protein
MQHQRGKTKHQYYYIQEQIVNKSPKQNFSRKKNRQQGGISTSSLDVRKETRYDPHNPNRYQSFIPIIKSHDKQKNSRKMRNTVQEYVPDDGLVAPTHATARSICTCKLQDEQQYLLTLHKNFFFFLSFLDEAVKMQKQNTNPNAV